MPKAKAGVLTTATLVAKIMKFCELYSGRKFYPYQEQFARRIIRSVLENDGEEMTALFSRQAGKSETVAIVVGGLMIILPTLANLPMFSNDVRLQMFKDGIMIGIFAPGERQAKTTYGKIKSFIEGDRASAIFADPEFNLGFTCSNGQTVALTNGSSVTAYSASEGSNIEGESLMLIICEEAQDISEYKIVKSIQPMGAAYNATLVDIGTATSYIGYFFNAIQLNKSEDTKKTSILRNHFEYDWTVAAKYNPKYLKYVDKAKKKYGENSDYFRMSYKLEWILERGMFIDINTFLANNTENLLERSMYDKISNHVVGIDVGGKGDSTVVTVIEVDWNRPITSESQMNDDGQEETYETFNSYVKDWFEIKDIPDYEEQFALIMDYLSHFKISKLAIDATREKSLADRLRANVSYEVIPYVFTQKAKSDLYKVLDREISAGRVRVPSGSKTKETTEFNKCIQELADLQKSYSGANMVVRHPTTRNAHDDYPDSLALAVWCAQSRVEITEVKSTNNAFTARTRVEKRMLYTHNILTAKRRRG